MADTEVAPKKRARRNDYEPVKAQAHPDWAFELAALAQGNKLIAGVDEVGRGSWAGPLVAGAVVFAPELIAAAQDDDQASAYDVALAEIAGVRDSKQLSHLQRETLDVFVRKNALAVGLGIVSPALCDAIGMGAANRLAMTRAVRALAAPIDLLLLDAFKLPLLRVPQQSIIKGDSRSYTIAAASIVAKVARDNMMTGFDVDWPVYGFGKHKGYGTAEHAEALLKAGPCPLHRRCFAPVREAILSRL